MSVMKTIVLRELAQLQAGCRAWFWFSLDVPVEHPPFLLQAFRTDPTGIQFRAQIRRHALPEDAITSTGVANVDAIGRLKVYAPRLSRAKLQVLSRWTARHITVHPELARLKDTTFGEVNTAGQVLAEHAQPSLWDFIPTPCVPGTIQHTDQQLAQCQPGQRYWFLLTDKGPQSVPFLLLGTALEDIDGREFSLSMHALMRRVPERGILHQGVLHVTDAGQLVLTAPWPIHEGQELMRGLLQAHAKLLQPLKSARLVALRDGKVVAHANLQPPAHDQTAQVLQEMTEGHPVDFWFTDAAIDGHALLLMANDLRTLKQQAHKKRGDGQRVRGQVSLTARGWLHFQTRTPYPNFIQHLARWVQQHQLSTPALSRLVGARMTLLDRDGRVLQRQKNDRAWCDQ